jgi:hypothetical protein
MADHMWTSSRSAVRIRGIVRRHVPTDDGTSFMPFACGIDGIYLRSPRRSAQTLALDALHLITDADR